MTDPIAKTNFQVPLLARPYVFNLYFHDGSHDMLSFFRKENYWVKISLGVTRNALFAVAMSLNTGGPNHINRDFLLLACQESIMSIKPLQQRMTNREVLHIERMVPMLNCIGNVPVHPCFRIFENLAVDVLLGS